MCRYHLLVNRQSQGIGMDIKPITEVLKLMMRELPDDRVADCLSRFRYQRINMGRLCKDKLDKICQQYLKTPWDDIDHDHCSWMCDTTSIADRGFSKHRWPDGSPRSDKALEHDECLKVVAALYRGKARRRPEKLITMEQPENNIFLGLQPVRNMVGDQGWQILRASHCKASGSAMDKAFQQNNRFSQKDSIYVVHGVQSDPPLQLTGMCNNDCIQRLTTQPTRHKMLICSSSRMLDGQEKIHDVTVKSRIPYGIWHRLWLSNCVVNGLARDLRRDEAAINAVHVIGRRPCSGELLHARLNHPGESVMRATLRESGLRSKPFAGPCRACLAGKMMRRPSTGHLQRGTYLFELLHADIQEFEVPDLQGHRYSLMMVEDLSRQKFVYLLKRKNDAGAAFQELCRQEKPPAILRTDGAGEFGSRVRKRIHIFGEDTGMLTVCSMYNIRKEETVAEDHDMMGVAENANGQAVRAVRSMLYAADLPKQFWGPAITHWAWADQFTVNTNEGRSPFHIRHGHAPTVEISKLRVWGSRVTFFGKTEQEQKLDMPGHRGIYIGQNPVNGGHYIYDQESVDPRVICTNEVWNKGWDENVVLEPVGVSDDDIKLIENSMPHRDEWSYPAVRAVHGTVRDLPRDGMGSMWQGYQQFYRDTIIGLRKDKPDLSHNDLQKKVGRLWREKGYKEDLRRDRARRVALLDHSTQETDHHSEDESDRQDLEDVIEQTLAEGSVLGEEAQQAILDLPCAICHKSESSDAYEMLVCDACERAYHLVCIGATEVPSGEDDKWFCSMCRREGMRVEVWLAKRINTRSRPRRAEEARPGTISCTNKDGTCTVTFDDDGLDEEKITIDNFPWRPVAVKQVTNVALMNAVCVDAAPDLTKMDVYMAPPRTAKEALSTSNPYRNHWAGAMVAHYQSLYAKGVFARVSKRQAVDAEVLPSMWVFVIKPDKLKARLVIVGSRAMQRPDLLKSAPTPRAAIWKMMFALAVKLGYKIFHMDLSAGFCHAKPKRQVCIRMPEGLREEDPDGYLMVIKNLFGMPEAGYDLHILVRNWMVSYGFAQHPMEPCLYMRGEDKQNDWPQVFVVCWVDDFACIMPDEFYHKFKRDFQQTFDAEDLGLLSRWMGMEMYFHQQGLYITQRRQSELIVSRAKLPTGSNIKVPMTSARLSLEMCCGSEEDKAFMRDKPYRTFVGALGYLTSHGIRYDLAFCQKECARYADKAGPGHWKALVRALHYLRKTPGKGLLYPANTDFTISAHCDADYNGTVDERLSTTGITVDFGGALIAAISRSQKFSSKSVGEAEYGALAACAAELLFYRQFLELMGYPQGMTGCAAGEKGSMIWSDSATALANAEKQVGWLSDKLKHVSNHLHFFRQYVQCGWLALCKIGSKLNRADVCTKGMDSEESFRGALHYLVDVPRGLQEGQ
jgi:hypothetical protein